MIDKDDGWWSLTESEVTREVIERELMPEGLTEREVTPGFKTLSAKSFKEEVARAVLVLATGATRERLIWLAERIPHWLLEELLTVPVGAGMGVWKAVLNAKPTIMDTSAKNVTAWTG